MSPGGINPGCVTTEKGFVFRERSLFTAGEGVGDFFNPKQHKSITPPLADSNFV